MIKFDEGIEQQQSLLLSHNCATWRARSRCDLGR